MGYLLQLLYTITMTVIMSDTAFPFAYTMVRVHNEYSDF